MNLMEELIYNTKDYIELADLIQELEKHNESEENDYYPVITFLISHDFANKIAFYDTTYFRADKLDKSANKAFEQWLQNAYEYLLEYPECTFQVLSNGIQDKIAFPIMAVNRHELEALPFMKGKFIDYSYIKCEIPVFENGKEPVPPIKAPVTHDFLPNPPPYEQLLAENQKLIMEINRLLNERDNKTEPSQVDQPKNIQTEKNSYLTTIGILLDMMLTPKGLPPKAPFQSQTAIITDIAERGIYGQGKATLEKRFSDANDQLSEINKSK